MPTPGMDELACHIARLREILDRIDEETRLPGEQPLRKIVADHAREQLAGD